MIGRARTKGSDAPLDGFVFAVRPASADGATGTVRTAAPARQGLLGLVGLLGTLLARGTPPAP